MIANMNEKGRQTKLLAAVAVFAMVVCALAVVMPSETEAVDIAEMPTADEDGIITIDGNYTLTASDTITDKLQINGTLTVASGVTLTINYQYKAQQESVITFGSNGQLVVAQGATMNINGSNASSYTSPQANHIFLGTVDQNQVAVDVAGTMNVTMAEGVDGTLNGNSKTIRVSGTYTSVGNGYQNTYFDINGGDVNITLRNGSVAGYIDVSGNGTLDIDGQNTVEAGTHVLLNIYSMNIASGASVSVDGTAQMYNSFKDPSSSAVDGMSLMRTENNGTLTTSTLTVTPGTALINNTGATVSGTVVNNGVLNNDGSMPGLSEEGTGVEIGSDGTVEIPGGAPDSPVTVDDVNVYFNAGATSVEITSGLIDVSKAFDGTIIIGASAGIANITVDKPVVIGENSILIINDCDGGIFYVTNGTSAENQAYFQSFVGENIRFTYGSIAINGSNLSGIITITGTDAVVDLSGQVATGNTAGADLTINMMDGAELNIDRNMTVDGELAIVNTSNSGTASVNMGQNITTTVNGTITLNSGVNFTSTGTFSGSGEISVKSGATFTYRAGTLGNVKVLTETGATVNITNGFGIENTVRTDLELVGTDNYLANDITIAEGATLTIGRNAALDLRGFDLKIEGTLVIERNGTIYSSQDDAVLVLMSTGSIQNNGGIVGSEDPVTIANGEKNTGTETEPVYSQNVTMQGISGLTIQLVRNSDRTYDMFVSGDVSRISGADAHELTLDNVGINADMTIGSGVILKITGVTTVSKDITFTHNGTYMTVATGEAAFKLSNGTTAVINSPVNGLITANVGNVTSGNQEPTGTTTFDLGGASDDTNTPVTYSGVTGITITVDRVTIPNESNPDNPTVNQRAYVTGTLDFENTDTSRDATRTGTATFNGVVYVEGTLTVSNDVTLDADANGTYVDVDEAGTLVVVSENPTVNFSGARYYIETTENNSNVTTYYYTNFAAAMEQIADAEENTVTVSGTFTISGAYELTGEQAIDFVSGSQITVGDDAQITVGVDSDINNLAFYTIEGRVTVTEGVGYRPSATYGNTEHYIYAVMTVEAETGTTTYSGFGIAIDNASPGETITVVGDATYDGNLVIPAQVTVDVQSEIDLTVYGNVTVEAEGTLNLNNGSYLRVGETGSRDYTITVNGTLDASEGGNIVKNATTGNVDLYSTGTTTIDTTSCVTTGVDLNAAYYEDEFRVYTSVANAVAYAAENALPSIFAVGTFSETGAVESDGVNIVILNNADVTLGDVTINGARIYSQDVAEGAAAGTVMGVYTANVSGLTGTGDEATISTVSVTKTNGSVTSTISVSAEGTNQYSLTISKIGTNTTIVEGTVEFSGTGSDSAISTSRNVVLTINSGATLLIAGDSTISGNNIINNGTISVDDGVNLTISNAIVPGNVIVTEGGVMTVPLEEMAIFTGTVTVETEGAFTVNGTLVVGEMPELLSQTTEGTITGEVDLGDEAIVYVFNGADVSAATFQNAAPEINSTAYSINGVSLATVYTYNAQAEISAVMNDIVRNLADLQTTTQTSSGTIVNAIIWYSDETVVSNIYATNPVYNYIGDYAEVSTEIQYRSVNVTISVIPHVTLSIDGIIVGTNPYALTIGTHTVSAVVDPGYNGDITITFAGQTVANGGTITITSDMLTQLDAPVMSVSGQLAQDSGSGDITVNVPSQDDGMSLTDILLIVLVILILVMAIIVALRLMRS